MLNREAHTMTDTGQIKLDPDTIVSGTLLGHHGTAPSGTISVHQDTVAVEWTGSAYRSIGSAARANLNADAQYIPSSDTFT